MPLKTRRNKGGGNEELINLVIEKAIKDYQEYNFLSSSTLRQIYLSLMYFLISFDKGELNIEYTSLPEDKEEMIREYLNTVLKNFSENELNEILDVDNFRVYGQVGNYITNPLPKNEPAFYRMPERLEKKFYQIKKSIGEIHPFSEQNRGGSFKRQRIIKVIRKY